MMKLLFCTGSSEKFAMAQLICEPLGIPLQQRIEDIDEIQSEDSEYIIRDKAAKAFALIQQPVVVSDDSWEMPGLRGFPGPYMKSINHWLMPEDLLRLTIDLTDRRVYLVQRLAYVDAKTTQLFDLRMIGEIQREVRGTYGLASDRLIAMDGDNGLTIAEVYDQQRNTADRDNTDVWQQLATWYIAQKMAP